MSSIPRPTLLPEPKRGTPWNKNYVFLVAFHVLCWAIYAIPICFYRSPLDKGQPVLDELHIVSLEQGDIYPTTRNNQRSDYDLVNDKSFVAAFLQDPVWTNDYWGRPMDSPNSHKSWRPLTVLSFRWLRFPAWMNDLQSHRLVNTILHAVTGELVALLALLLFCASQSATRPSPILSMTQNMSKRQIRQSLQRAQRYRDEQSRQEKYSFWLYCLAKLLFCLHPTHVEVTANAANRPHLIAVACTCLLANPRVPLAGFVIVLIVGFLSGETFLFGIVPAAATMLVITYRQKYILFFASRSHETFVSQGMPSLWKQTVWTIQQCVLRIMILLAGAVAYYCGRHYMDWLSIPEGLIRPAENPYFRLKGVERLVNYAHVTSLHIAKAWDMDWVGFSHEYGYQCLTPIETWRDVRILIPVGYGLILVIFPLIWFVLMEQCCTVQSLHIDEPWNETFDTQDFAEDESDPANISSDQYTESSEDGNTVIDSSSNGAMPPSEELLKSQTMSVWSTSFLIWAFHLSWMVTLFPIMGIVKVGTFVADRIVVCSSVSVCIMAAHVFASWLASSPKALSPRYSASFDLLSSFGCSSNSILCFFVEWRVILVGALLLMGTRRILLRTWEWMDSYPLLASSIRTCPRSAKSHLEISKIYSGLYPEIFDLSEARAHLEQVEEIDPSYCDVHFQFSHVAIQEQEFLELEERLVNALLCPFTTSQAMSMWQKYWEFTLRSGQVTTQRANERLALYQEYLQQALQEYEQKQSSEQSKERHSHLVNWRG